jgi:alpha-ketoglutarate-dependent taurine dioxygenase
MATITKIPGFGDYGVYVDGVDFNHMTDEEWMEFGQLHLKTLVTIFRDTKCEPTKLKELSIRWGAPPAVSFYRFVKKYNIEIDKLLPPPVAHSKAWAQLQKVADESDQQAIQETMAILEMPNVQRVTGKRHADGRRAGAFAEGELSWHSNESGQIVNTPGVMLLARENVVGTSTGFCITPNWYEEQTEAFRSELDEMVMLHDFVPGRMNPGLNDVQDALMKTNFAPEPDELPLVIQSPAGIRGLHFPVHTVVGIRGMAQSEADQMIKYISDGILKEPHIYDHWYQQQSGDLLCFDNSITLHRRLGGVAERLALRTPSSFSNLLPYQWQPYYQPEFAQRYRDRVMDMRAVLNLKNQKPFRD